jgi:hypothetical protein
LPRALVSLASIALALGVSQLAKSHIDEAAAARKLALPVVVPSPALAVTLALGQESFAADVFWLRVLEYYGDSRNRGARFAAAVPLFDLISELDPGFCAPYARAGLMLTSSEIERVGDANRLLRKGMESCPNESYIPFVLGFNLYYFQRRFREAGDVLAIAAKRPNAPEIVAELASRLKAHTGDLQAAEAFVLQMLEQESDPHAKDVLTRRLHEIETERVLRAFDTPIQSTPAPR